MRIPILTAHRPAPLHLIEVIRQMVKRGSPRLIAVKYPRLIVSLNGVHRLAAANVLTMPVEFDFYEPNQTVRPEDEHRLRDSADYSDWLWHALDGEDESQHSKRGYRSSALIAGMFGGGFVADLDPIVTLCWDASSGKVYDIELLGGDDTGRPDVRAVIGRIKSGSIKVETATAPKIKAKGGANA